MVARAYTYQSDIAAALEAARAAGWEHVSIVLETPDGHRIQVTAASSSCGDDTTSSPDMTPLEKWRADRVAR
jgi:hypothetical protein